MRIEPPESRSERRVGEPGGERGRGAAARAAGEATGASGFGTVPKCGFSEVVPNANSCRFVLPTSA